MLEKFLECIQSFQSQLERDFFLLQGVHSIVWADNVNLESFNTHSRKREKEAVVWVIEDSNLTRCHTHYERGLVYGSV